MKTHVGSVPSQSRRLGRTRENACCCFGGCHGGRFDWGARLRPSVAAAAAPARHQRIRAQQGYQEAGPLPFQQPRHLGRGLHLGRPLHGHPSKDPRCDRARPADVTHCHPAETTRASPAMGLRSRKAVCTAPARSRSSGCPLPASVFRVCARRDATCQRVRLPELMAVVTSDGLDALRQKNASRSDQRVCCCRLCVGGNRRPCAPGAERHKL